MKRMLILTTILVLSLWLVWQQAQLLSAKAGAGVVLCENGFAAEYPCKNVDLLAHLPLDEIGGDLTAVDPVKGNDHWGWHDEVNGRDYVLFGLRDGLSFIDITDRENPIYVGKLPGHHPDDYSNFSDVKVMDHFAYFVLDQFSNSGLQIFDLNQLASVITPPVTFTETAHFDGFSYAHNLWINEESAYLYVMRTDICPTITILNIADPLNPVPEGPNDNGIPGCFVDEPLDEIVSDAECLIYDGPDIDYHGRELCFIGSDKTLSIADVTSKTNPIIITNTLAYTDQIEVARLHQGVLTSDRRYWLVSDVWDERDFGHNTRTYVWDVQDLDQARYLGFYEHNTTARDHNVYLADGLAFQANWRAGLRVLSVGALPSTDFAEVGYFDIVPDSDSVEASGAWSNYPFWGGGIVTVSGTDEGLFILQFNREIFLPTLMK